MGSDFASLLAGGHSRVEYVFHICGMPWAVATSQQMVDLLDPATVGGQTARDTMFGDETYGAADNHYSHEVDVLPFLQPIPSVTVTNEDAMATLAGGKWTATIADLPPGELMWPHGGRTIYGLEGLGCIANPRIDSSILVAHLSDDLWTGGTSVSFSDDAGGLLGTACDAATSEAPIILWINGECMAATNGTTSGTDGTATGLARDLLNTVSASHNINRVVDSGYITVANAPLNGISNRPYVLWAFIVSDTAIVSGPVAMRHGKVSGDAGYKKGEWNILCLPWWSWLDSQVKCQSVRAQLGGFTLTSYDPDEVIEEHGAFVWSADPVGAYKYMGQFSPHITLVEFDASVGTHGEIDVTYGFLCDPHESVHYDTVEELEEKLCTLLTSISPNSWTYELREDIGPVVNSMATDDFYILGGDLVSLLRWGYYAGDKAARAEECSQMALKWYKRPWAFGGFCDPADPYVDNAHDVYLVTQFTHLTGGQLGSGSVGYQGSFYDSSAASSATTERPVKPDYMLQWGYSPEFWDYNINLGTYWQCHNSGYFPLCADETDGKYKIYVNETVDVSGLDAGTKVQIGLTDTGNCVISPPSTFTSSSYLEDYKFSTAGYFEVDAVGAGPTGTNYIEVAVSEVFPTAYVMTGEAAPDLGYTVAPKYQVGQILFGLPIQSDYWPVADKVTVTAPTLGGIFRALLGHGDSGYEIPEEYEANHVPYYDTVDWGCLDSMLEYGWAFPTVMKFEATPDANIWSLLNEELKLYRLTPTWEWDSTDDRYRIRFKRVGMINETMAYWSGRTIDDSLIKAGERPEAEHAYCWQINSINLSTNYDANSGQFGYVVKAQDGSSLAPLGGRAVSLDIKPKITTIPSLATSATTQAQVFDYLGSYFENTIDPRPAITIDCTIDNFLNNGVGLEVLLTVEDIHNPFDGAPGVTEWPALIASHTIDPTAGTAKYTTVINGRRMYGWAPSVAIKTSTLDGTTVTVEDIDYDGQGFAGTGATLNWYDHWLFAHCTYNDSMDAPELVTSDKFVCTLVERGTITPTIITGVVVESVDLRTYADVIAASGTFLELSGCGGYDDTAEWWLTYDAADQALKDAQRKFVYLAGTDLLVSNGTSDVTGTRWE